MDNCCQNNCNPCNKEPFFIPGPQGPQGIPGTNGKDGNSVQILGSYDDIDQLEAEQTTGTIGDGYLVQGDLYVWSDNDDEWINVGRIQGPTGPQGPQGKTGPQGLQGEAEPTKISAAYLVTFNNFPEEGLEIRENIRLPITRKELDTDSICDLDPNEGTFHFSKIGYYKVTFVVNAYVPYFNTVFDPKIDFVSVGLRLVGTDNIYVGDSQWITDETSKKLVDQGILAINNLADVYELANLSKRALYLSTPDLKNINSNSYFSNAPITIILEYLGRI